MTEKAMIEYKVIVYDNGNKYWFLNGDQNRKGGPAYTLERSDKFWYLNGKLHSEHGPAVEYADGSKAWYLRGERLTEKEWKAKTSKPSHEGREVEIDSVAYTLRVKEKTSD